MICIVKKRLSYSTSKHKILRMGSPGLRTGCLYLCLALLGALILLTTLIIHWVIATTNLGLVSSMCNVLNESKILPKSQNSILDGPWIPQLGGRWHEGNQHVFYVSMMCLANNCCQGNDE